MGVPFLSLFLAIILSIIDLPFKIAIPEIPNTTNPIIAIFTFLFIKSIF